MKGIPENIINVLDRLHAAGHEAYIVGGCVRDLLMGRVPGDFDVCTSALPEETERVFSGERVIETGIKHGTVTVLSGGTPVEITTFRVDGHYSDGRHPDSVSFSRTLSEDLARRDFTVNAMAWSKQSGIVDLYGGRTDIESGVLRCVGDPEQRFSEDALRILRALRFAATLGFEIEPRTDSAARKLCGTLSLVSGERKRVELEKLLTGEHAGTVLRSYPEVLGAVIPDVLPMVGYDQENYHHIYDLYEHTVITVENCPQDAGLRIAALLHDIGKPAVRVTDQDGIAHYWGHEKKSAEMAGPILRALRYSNAEAFRILMLVEHHWTDIRETEPSVRRAIRDFGRDLYFDLVCLMKADNASKAPDYVIPEFYDHLRTIGSSVLERGLCCSLKELAVDGNDLIALGMKPGRDLRQKLERLLDAVIDGECENRKEDLIMLYRKNG